MNAFKGKSINYKEAEIYQINFEEQSKRAIFDSLIEFNLYNKEKIFNKK